jgi:putative ABC transport system permease protein
MTQETHLLNNLEFGWRMLARNPGFSLVAIITLALGTGVNTAIFSVVEGVLLKPLPFRDPGQLMMVWQRHTSRTQLGISELDLDDYKARTRVFEGLAGYTVPGVRTTIMTGTGDASEVSASYVTRDYLRVLGVQPAVGRDFLSEEYERGRNRVAILGYAFWQSRFGGAPEITSRQITLNQQKLQIVGVAPPDVYPPETDVFVPFTALNPERPLPRNYHELNVVGRMRPGQSADAAQREMSGLTGELERAYPGTNSGIGVYVSPLREEITGKVQEPILMLLAAVGLVLLIACGNVANLLLVRAAGRQKEIAIRVALGASRGNIAGQFLTECLMLSAAGTSLGLLLAYAVMPVIRRLGAERIPRLQHMEIDVMVLLFTAVIGILAGVAFGMTPASWSIAKNLNEVLRTGGRSSRSESRRLRQVLIVVEVALALTVLVGAGLLARSLSQLLDVHPGFHADHLLVANLSLPRNRYPQDIVNNFYARLLPRIAAISGVKSVSTTTALPLATSVNQLRFTVQGAPAPAAANYPVTGIVSVDAGFFETMGIPILRGREFTREEVGNLAPEHCIASAALVREYFGGRDPVGQTILSNVAAAKPEACQIVGVAGDVHMETLDLAPGPLLYFAAYVGRGMLVVRTTIDPMAVAAAIQREVSAADPEQPLSNIRPMDQVILRSISRRSFAAVLLAIFAALGTILAALGLYGLMSYSVAQRKQEIGLRMALGAEPAVVMRAVLIEGLRVAGAGLVVGVVAALAVTRLMSNLVYGIATADPLSFLLGCGLLLLTAALACFFPAYRATQVDPMVALRHE